VPLPTNLFEFFTFKGQAPLPFPRIVRVSKIKFEPSLFLEFWPNPSPGRLPLDSGRGDVEFASVFAQASMAVSFMAEIRIWNPAAQASKKIDASKTGFPSNPKKPKRYTCSFFAGTHLPHQQRSTTCLICSEVFADETRTSAWGSCDRPRKTYIQYFPPWPCFRPSSSVICLISVPCDFQLQLSLSQKSTARTMGRTGRCVSSTSNNVCKR